MWSRRPWRNTSPWSRCSLMLGKQFCHHYTLDLSLFFLHPFFSQHVRTHSPWFQHVHTQNQQWNRYLQSQSHGQHAQHKSAQLTQQEDDSNAIGLWPWSDSKNVSGLGISCTDTTTTTQTQYGRDSTTITNEAWPERGEGSKGHNVHNKEDSASTRESEDGRDSTSILKEAASQREREQCLINWLFSNRYSCNTYRPRAVTHLNSLNRLLGYLYR